MMKRNKIILSSLAGLLIIIIAVVSLNGGTRVETVAVSRGDVTQTVEDTGYVQAVDRFELFATQQARIVSVPVKTGQTVSQGQVLVVMESPDLIVEKETVAGQVAQNQAGIVSARESLERSLIQLKEAEKNLQRTTELLKAGGVSTADYDQARLTVDELKKTVAEQQANLNSLQQQSASTNKMYSSLSVKEGQLILKSPLNGVILDLPARVEQVVAPASLLAAVGNPDLIEVKADILSDDLAGINIGQRVTIKAPVLGGKILAGQVKQIYPEAREKTSALGVIQRRVPVIISLLDKANLQPGYEVRVEIATAEKRGVLCVPLEAVRTNEQGQKQVAVVKNGRVELRSIKIGIADHQYGEIKSGVRAGEQIIRDGSQTIKNGQRVKIAR
ncbi:MAG: efflux RND transporter periplasmic adaptor subunit [Methylocystaceae bacterium]